jgi:linoleoyl-CoA desaturase
MYFNPFILVNLYIAPFVLILTLNLWPWQALMLAILMGFGEAGIGMSVMHDAALGVYSKKGWVNTLVPSSMFLMGKYHKLENYIQCQPSHLHEYL